MRKRIILFALVMGIFTFAGVTQISAKSTTWHKNAPTKLLGAWTTDVDKTGAPDYTKNGLYVEKKEVFYAYKKGESDLYGTKVAYRKSKNVYLIRGYDQKAKKWNYLRIIYSNKRIIVQRYGYLVKGKKFVKVSSPKYEMKYRGSI